MAPSIVLQLREKLSKGDTVTASRLAGTRMVGSECTSVSIAAARVLQFWLEYIASCPSSGFSSLPLWPNSTVTVPSFHWSRRVSRMYLAEGAALCMAAQ